MMPSWGQASRQKQSTPAPNGTDQETDSEETLTRLDPSGAAIDSKRTAALLRDASGVLRRLDTLAATSLAADNPAVALVTDARHATEYLVEQLAR
jgi:hypothetical protein